LSRAPRARPPHDREVLRAAGRGGRGCGSTSCNKPQGIRLSPRRRLRGLPRREDVHHRTCWSRASVPRASRPTSSLAGWTCRRARARRRPRARRFDRAGQPAAPFALNDQPSRRSRRSTRAQSRDRRQARAPGWDERREHQGRDVEPGRHERGVRKAEAPGDGRPPQRGADRLAEESARSRRDFRPTASPNEDSRRGTRPSSSLCSRARRSAVPRQGDGKSPVSTSAGDHPTASDGAR